MNRSKMFCFVSALAIVAGLAGMCQASFVNTTVPGMQLWLSADAGTTLIEGKVDTWADQSGNGNDATALASSNRPVLATAAIGAKTMDVLRFDGANDVLTLGTTGGAITRQDHTVYFVTARTGGTASTTGNLFGFDKTGGRGSDGWYYKFTQGNVNMESGSGTAYGYQLANSQPNNKYIIGQGRYSSADTTATLSINGAPPVIDTATAASLNEPAGTRFNIGAFDSSPFTNYYMGDIAEIIVYDRALTASEQQTVLGYFAGKYDIEMHLPLEPLALELKARWSFDVDGSDSVGGNDLALQAGASIAPGQFGGALSVSNSASDGFASALSSEDLDVRHQFSAAAWLKYDENNDSYARVIARLQDGSNGYNVAFENSDTDPSTSKLVVRVLHEGSSYFATTQDALLTQDEFHHLAFAFDDLAGPTATDKITIWIDGQEVDSDDTSGGGSVQGSAALVVGRGTSSTSDFSGMIDNMQFYCGVLDQETVDALQVPEPSTFVLLGALLAAVCAYARKRP